jgi:hypothetical protein
LFRLSLTGHSTSIHADKLSLFLLNPTHNKGKSRHKFFLMHGFTRENPAQLGAALLEHPHTATLIDQRPAEGNAGSMFEYQCNMTTPEGRLLCVFTAWELRADGVLHFVTCLPKSN